MAVPSTSHAGFGAFHLEKDSSKILDILESGNLSDLEDFLSDDEAETDVVLPQTCDSIPRIGGDKSGPSFNTNQIRYCEQEEVSDDLTNTTENKADNDSEYNHIISQKKTIKWHKSEFNPPKIMFDGKAFDIIEGDIDEENSRGKRQKGERRPIPEVRCDLTDHMPQLDGDKEGKRCKNKNCSQKTHFLCEKCNVHLCIKKDRNCFTDFHRGSKS